MELVGVGYWMAWIGFRGKEGPAGHRRSGQINLEVSCGDANFPLSPGPRSRPKAKVQERQGKFKLAGVWQVPSEERTVDDVAPAAPR
jgi:hypothetical protein